MFGRFFHDVIDFYLLFGAISLSYSVPLSLCDVYLSSFWHQWCHHLTFIRVLHHILYRWKESERWLQLANVACLFSVRWKALFAYLQIWLMVFQVTFIDFVALKWHLVLSSTASIFLFVHRVSFKVESAVLFFVVGMAWARAFEAVERTVDSFNFFFRFFFRFDRARIARNILEETYETITNKTNRRVAESQTKSSRVFRCCCCCCCTTVHFTLLSQHRRAYSIPMARLQTATIIANDTYILLIGHIKFHFPDAEQMNNRLLKLHFSNALYLCATSMCAFCRCVYFHSSAVVVIVVVVFGGIFFSLLYFLCSFPFCRMHFLHHFQIIR